VTDRTPQDQTEPSAVLPADCVVHDLLASEAEAVSNLADVNREASDWARRYQEACAEIERLKRGCGAHPSIPGYEHPACGFHWHGKDGLDVPVGPWTGGTREPLCPRCELARVTAELAAAAEALAIDAEALAQAMYAAYVAVLRERGAGPIFSWEELGECEDPDDCACADTVAGFLAAARVALDRIAQVTVDRGRLSADLVQLRESAAEFLAIYDRYEADEVSAAGAWGDVVRLVAGIPERQAPAPRVRLGRCVTHAGEEHVMVNTAGHWLCVLALRGLDGGWTELTAVNAELRTKTDSLRAALERLASVADQVRLYNTQASRNRLCAEIVRARQELGEAG
jgi:hypothetical protein